MHGFSGLTKMLILHLHTNCIVVRRYWPCAGGRTVAYPFLTCFDDFFEKQKCFPPKSFFSSYSVTFFLKIEQKVLHNNIQMDLSLADTLLFVVIGEDASHDTLKANQLFLRHHRERHLI